MARRRAACPACSASTTSRRRDRVEMLSQFAHNFGIEAGFGPELSPRGLAAFEAQFRGTAIAPAMRTVLGKMLGPARYTVHPSPHFGLAAPLYLHFTSPIRRYADLAVHRIVKRYLAGDRSLAAGDPAHEALAEECNRLAYRATQGRGRAAPHGGGALVRGPRRRARLRQRGRR